MDLRSEELWRGSRRVRCQRQPFRVLRRLLEDPGEVVSREELQRAIWGGETPSDADHSLGIAVNKLREALGDSADAPRFIETLSRRGYRFIAPVEFSTTSAAPPLKDLTPNVPASGTPAVPMDAAEVGASPGGQLQLAPATQAFAAGKARETVTLARSPRLMVVWAVLLLMVGALAGLLLSRAGLGAAASLRRIDQVTSNNSIFPGEPSMESFPVLVSDGSRLYSSILEDGRTEIASIDPTTGEMQQLQLPSEIANPTLSDISPDRGELLIRSHLSSDSEQPVWMVPRGGGSAQRVGNVSAHDAVWMPDGKTVLYATGNELRVVRLADGSTQQFALLPGRGFWMRWSPDGKLLRLTILDPLSHTSSLWEIADHGTARPLLPGWSTPSSECCGVWTTDGAEYVFESSHDGSADLWQVHDAFAGSPEKLTNGPLRFAAPVSGRGGELFFAGMDVHSELERFDRALQAFVVDRSFLGRASRVIYSRDRAWVAWTGVGGRLWRARAADGTEKLQLTPDDMEVFLAQWSPDGRRLLAMARKPGRPWELYLVSAEGGVPEMLLHEDRNEADPTWSSDGRQVAFGRIPDMMGRESSPKQIEVLDLSTGNIAALPGSEGMFSPRWSPDGRWIAALTLGEQKLMLYDIAARSWRAMGDVRAADPVWTADSSALYVHTAFRNPQAIERVAVPSGSSSVVATLGGTMVSNKADYVFVGITQKDEPLVRVRTATGNLYRLSAGR